MPSTQTNHADSWLALRRKMEATAKAARPNWAFKPNLDVSKTQSEDEWLRFCQSHRQVVDSLIRQWIETGSASSPSLEVQFLLAMRFHAVARFAALHAFAQRGVWWSVFPLPALSEQEQLSSLLIDWWWGVGVFQSFDDGWMVTMEA